jgi:ABC-type transport system substrate-binding protein
MKLGKKLVAVAVAAITALSLGACTSSNGSSNTPGASSENKTLRLATGGAPATFKIGAWAGGEAYLFLSVYDTVVGRDLEGKVVPGLAESWTYSDDAKTLTLKIRTGQTFSNGEPVDAAAVVASLEAARKGTASAQTLASITEVKTSDATTVVISLARPDAALLPILASTSGAVGAPKVLTAESSQLEPVGSGAYTIDKAGTTTGAMYKLKRNPNYWNAKAYPFETVEMRIIADPTALQNAMLAGQLDFTTVGADALPTYATNNKFVTGESKPQAVGALWIADRAGTKVPALGDVRVRQAINKVLDRELITSSLTAGSSYPTNQVFNPIGQAYSKDLATADKFDVDAAKKLMADAGFAGGFNVTMPSSPLTTAYESAISQALGEIGIKVNWETVAMSDFFTKIFSQTYPMYFFYNGFTGSDAQDATASTSGLFNPFQFTTPEFQALMNTANAAPVDQQAKAFQAVNKYIVDQAWVAPLFYATGNYVTSKNVTFTPPAIGFQTFQPFRPAGS